MHTNNYVFELACNNFNNSTLILFSNAVIIIKYGSTYSKD